MRTSESDPPNILILRVVLSAERNEGAFAPLVCFSEYAISVKQIAGKTVYVGMSKRISVASLM